MKRYLAVAFVCAAASAVAMPVDAQSVSQFPLQFDFLTPGARSLGMGATFVGVDDDATAAFTNPAGLTLLGRPEVSAEVRYRSLDTPFLLGGRISGAPTNTGLDTAVGPVYGTSGDTAARPYYLSAVVPVGRLAFAVYRHELVRQDNSFLSNGAFETSTFNGSPSESRLFPLRGRRTITVDSYGASAAYRITSQLAVGAGAVFYRLDLSSDFQQLGVTSFYGAPDPTTRLATLTQQGAGTKPGVNGGLLWSPSRRLRVGAAFRQGVTFDFTQVDTVPSLPTSTRTGNFSTPTAVAAGARVQATEDLSFSVDVDRVLYSSLDDFLRLQAPSAIQTRVSVPDGTEVHGGAELVLSRFSHAPALRVGAWFDPDHSLHYASDNSNSQVDLRSRALLPGDRSLVHYCFGAGVPISSAFEINAGADLTSQRKYASASIVARF